MNVSEPGADTVGPDVAAMAGPLGISVVSR